MEKITVWQDRANIAYIQLTKNGVVLTAEEMGLITKVEFKYLGVFHNSADHPDSFDWTNLADEGKLQVKLGLVGMTPGQDVAELIIYDANSPEGIVWMQIAVWVRTDAAVV